MKKTVLKRTSPAERKGRAIGVFLSALSAALFGFLGFFASLGRSRGFTTQTLLAFRFGFAALALGLYAKLRGRRLALPLPTLLEVGVVGIVGNGLTALAIFLAYERISTSLTITLHFFYPVTIAVAACILGRERFSLRKAAAILLAIVGTAVILSPDGERLDVFGVVLAIASAFSYTVYVVGIGSRRLASLDRFVLVFWICLFAAIAQFINVIATGTFVVKFDVLGILAILAMALFSTAFSFIALTEGIRRVGPTTAAILSTLEPITTAFIGIAVLGERFSSFFAVGAALILVSTIIVVIPERG